MSEVVGAGAEDHRPDDRDAFDRGAVLTVGTFDGVHRGHADVLVRLAARARDTGRRSVLITFAGHPAETLRPDRAPKLLTPGREKLEAIASAPAAIDRVVVLPFTPALAALSAEDFVRQLLRDRYRMRELLVGHDHGFGRGRSGDASTLQALGARDGFPVEVVPPVLTPDGSAVSSTVIRDAIARADFATATAHLGHPYAARGHVVRGDQRGRLLGFPTLNVALPDGRKLLPPDGVYAVRASLPDGTWGGMLNLGARPTFGDAARSLEVHLFDASGDWYGAPVRVEFVARLRDVRRFDGVAALVAQLGADAAAARTLLAAGSGSVDPPPGYR